MGCDKKVFRCPDRRTHEHPVLQFTENFLIPSGNNSADLGIFELGSFESVDVAISGNGIDWFGVGQTAAAPPGIIAQEIDIDAFLGVTVGQKFSFVRLIDVGGMVSPSPHAGADIDAVEAISTVPVPEPASLLLMGSGLAGLLAYFRRDSTSRH